MGRRRPATAPLSITLQGHTPLLSAADAPAEKIK